MTDPPNSNTTIYAIRLKGHLEPRWLKVFNGMVITLDDNGDTLLSGPVADQAALYGLLKKVRDVGLTLLSVNSVEPDSQEVHEA